MTQTELIRPDVSVIVLSWNGQDYIEGNAGSDILLGNQNQDDLVGGNSDMFSLKDLVQIPQLLCAFALSLRKGEEFKVKI